MSIKDLIAQGESTRLEFKSTLQWDVHHRKQNKALRHSVLKTLAAFLNTEGGTLIIGVEDDGRIHGLDDDLALVGQSRDKFEQLLADLISDSLGSQYAPLIKGRFEDVDERLVYVIDVQPAPHPAYLKGQKGNEFYMRLQTTTRSLDPQETVAYIQHHWGSTGTLKHGITSKVNGGTHFMNPFHTIAIPHDDILQGRLTLDVFAADLWEVYHDRGPEEYRDADLFFQKTYLTKGLENLFEVVEKRLQGQGGDPVIQMQTPFGGGKTHSLIALYHKARGWGARRVVISGTLLAASETLWGLMAQQLTGTREGFEDRTAPGREAIQRLLAAHQPVLVLMDEVLEYITKAAGVTIGQSTLAAQTMAFMQELTEAAATLEKVAVVVALPSSTLEHYDEQAVRLFEQLKKISGRVEKIFTPVQDEEVGAIIRRRLFAHVNEQAAAEVVNAFVEQAEREALLPHGEESAAYRARFRQTYPFLPEVVDVLYHRWGSFPSFQRTRGTLRLLALVVSALKSSGRPYISLADFDLTDSEIRRELLKHTGNEYDSVLAADIVGPQAGARRANTEIGKAYQGLGLGERVATTIFMYSFLGGGGEAGATIGEIKRHNLMSGVPSSVVAEVLQKLSNRFLFFLHESGGRYYFSTTANLNRALTIRMENLNPAELREAEREALRRSVGGMHLKTFIWPEHSADIPDDDAPKLLILAEADQARMEDFLRNKGQTPRVHRNTLFFLTPLPTERIPFGNLLRRKLALANLLQEKTLSLAADQRQELKEEAKQAADDVQEQIGRLYRLLYLPDRDGLREVDMGIPTVGTGHLMDARAYECLIREGRLVGKLAPLVIKERYLKDGDYVETRQLVQSGSRTPGEMLVTSRQVWEESIAAGVRQGLFGLGELDAQGEPRCHYFKEEPSVSLEGREVLIRAEICAQQRATEATMYPAGHAAGTWAAETAMAGDLGGPVVAAVAPDVTQPLRQALTLTFELPFGQVANLLGLLNLLQERFRRIHITIRLSEGGISEAEIEDKIRETFRQIGTEVEIE